MSDFLFVFFPFINVFFSFSHFSKYFHKKNSQFHTLNLWDDFLVGGERSPLFFDNRRRHRHPSHLFHRFSAVALVFGPAGLSLRYPFQLQRRRFIKK